MLKFLLDTLLLGAVFIFLNDFFAFKLSVYQWHGRSRTAHPREGFQCRTKRFVFKPRSGRFWLERAVRFRQVPRRRQRPVGTVVGRSNCKSLSRTAPVWQEEGGMKNFNFSKKFNNSDKNNHDKFIYKVP